jgi:hypothetical protein
MTAHGRHISRYIVAELGARTDVAWQVRKTPSWPRSWANFSLLYLYPHWSARANLHLLGNLTPFSLQPEWLENLGGRGDNAKHTGQKVVQLPRPKL